MSENIGGFRGKGRIKQVQMDVAPDETYDVVCGGTTPNGRGVKRPSRYEQETGSFDVVCGGQRKPRSSSGGSGKRRGPKPKAQNGQEFVEVVVGGAGDDDSDSSSSSEDFFGQDGGGDDVAHGATSNSQAEEVHRSGSGRSIKRNVLYADYQGVKPASAVTPRSRPPARVAPTPDSGGKDIGRTVLDGCGNVQINLGRLPSPGTLKLHLKVSASAEHVNLMRLYGQIAGPVTLAGAAGVEANGLIRAWNGTSWVDLSSVGAIRPEVWMSLVFVFARGKLTLYIDGAKQQQVDCGWDFANYDLVVGSKFLGQNGSWFKGEMEPPQMWPFEMTDTEVLELFPQAEAEAEATDEARPSKAALGSTPRSGNKGTPSVRTPKPARPEPKDIKGAEPTTPMRTGSGRVSKKNNRYMSDSDSEAPKGGSTDPLWIRAFRRPVKRTKKPGLAESAPVTGKEYAKWQRVQAKFEVQSGKATKIEWYSGTVHRVEYKPGDRTCRVTVHFDADGVKEVYELPDDRDDLRALEENESEGEQAAGANNAAKKRRSSEKRKPEADASEDSARKKSKFNLDWFVPSGHVVKPPQSLIGCRLRIYWDGENAWFQGTVDHDVDLKKGKYHIVYEDGDDEDVTVPDSDVLVYCPPGSKLLSAPTGSLSDLADDLKPKPGRGQRSHRRGTPSNDAPKENGQRAVPVAVAAVPQNARSASLHADAKAEEPEDPTPTDSNSNFSPMKRAKSGSDEADQSYGAPNIEIPFLKPEGFEGEASDCADEMDDYAADPMVESVFGIESSCEKVDDLPPIGDASGVGVEPVTPVSTGAMDDKLGEAEPGDFASTNLDQARSVEAE